MFTFEDECRYMFCKDAHCTYLKQCVRFAYRTRRFAKFAPRTCTLTVLHVYRCGDFEGCVGYDAHVCRCGRTRWCSGVCFINTTEWARRQCPRCCSSILL